MRVTPLVVIVVVGVVNLALSLLVNIAQGTLGTPSVGTLYDDTRTALGLIHPSRAPEFGLLDDWASLVQGALLVCFVAVLYRQWQLIGTLIRDLHRSGAIHVDVSGRTSFDATVHATNAGWRRWGRTGSATVLAGAGAVAGIGFLLITRVFGVFAVLAPETGSEAPNRFAAEAYEHWWAALRSPWLGAIGYVLLLAGGLYLLILQNIIGVKTLGLFLRHRGVITFGVDRRNCDGHYGWKPLRQLLVTIYLCVLIHALILLMFLVVMPLEGVAIMLAVAFASLLFLYPAYLVVPVVWARRKVIEHREKMIRNIEEAAIRQRVGGGLADRLAYEHHVREEIAAIRSIPPSPFRMRQILTGAVVYALPAALGIIQIVQLFV